MVLPGRETVAVVRFRRRRRLAAGARLGRRRGGRRRRGRRRGGGRRGRRGGGRRRRLRRRLGRLRGRGLLRLGIALIGDLVVEVAQPLAQVLLQRLGRAPRERRQLLLGLVDPASRGVAVTVVGSRARIGDEA